jgi:uncharacterized phage-associated protein
MSSQANSKEVYTPSHIANYFLWRAREDKVKDMTPMKLIKLVYIAYGWAWTIFKRELFSEKIEAWKYGPVIPSLYHEFKRYRYKAIDRYSIYFDPVSGEDSYPMVPREDRDIIKMLHIIWNIYKDKKGNELSDITHGEDSPWCRAIRDAKGKVNPPIKNDDIKQRVDKYLESLAEDYS